LGALISEGGNYEIKTVSRYSNLAGPRFDRSRRNGGRASGTTTAHKNGSDAEAASRMLIKPRVIKVQMSEKV